MQVGVGYVYNLQSGIGAIATAAAGALFLQPMLPNGRQFTKRMHL